MVDLRLVAVFQPGSGRSGQTWFPPCCYALYWHQQVLVISTLVYGCDRTNALTSPSTVSMDAEPAVDMIVNSKEDDEGTSTAPETPTTTTTTATEAAAPLTSTSNTTAAPSTITPTVGLMVDWKEGRMWRTRDP